CEDGADDCRYIGACTKRAASENVEEDVAARASFDLFLEPHDIVAHAAAVGAEMRVADRDGVSVCAKRRCHNGCHGGDYARDEACRASYRFPECFDFHT